LAPATVPLSRSRSAAFDDLVLAAVDALSRALPDRLAARLDLDRVEVVVADVPRTDPGPAAVEVPLGAAVAPGRGRPARLVVYRRPVEARAVGRNGLERLLRRVVAEQVADLLGVEATDVDPGLERP
jgi:hypothetical protein